MMVAALLVSRAVTCAAGMYGLHRLDASLTAVDTARLRAKAIERGVITAHDQLGQDQLCALIFQPRLSTAAEVSEISGRGEGMAAVADAVKRVDGTIRVTSTPGLGTTIAIEVPKPRSQRTAAAA